MGDNQYDISPEMKRLFDEKQKLRAAAKEYYRNLIYSPYRKEGTVFDPAIQRFTAMSMYHVQLYKPKRQFTRYLALFAPPLILYYFVNQSRNKKESLLRSGLVSYEQRYRSALY